MLAVAGLVEAEIGAEGCDRKRQQACAYADRHFGRSHFAHCVLGCWDALRKMIATRQEGSNSKARSIDAEIESIALAHQAGTLRIKSPARDEVAHRCRVVTCSEAMAPILIMSGAQCLHVDLDAQPGTIGDRDTPIHNG